jgi:hypothetical protein
MKKAAGESPLFILATGAGAIAAMGGLGGLLWSLRPPFLRQYLDSGGTGSLLILFLGVPAVLALLGALGFICGALLVRPIVFREDVERALLSGPFGGHMGRFELWLLAQYKPRGSRT